MFSNSQKSRPTTYRMWQSPAISVLPAVLLLVTSAFAAEIWDKPPQQWTLADVYQILRDSPWSPSKGKVDVSFKYEERRVDPRTGPVNSSDPRGAIDRRAVAHAGLGGSAPLPDVSVQWWSSKTLRLAQQRLRQLRDATAAKELLRAEPAEDIVIVVEGSEPLRILRDAEENPRETSFLELPGGRMLDVRDVKFFEGEKAGEDYVAFHFPRELNGRPTIDRNAEKVVFHCKAAAKNAKPGRQNALSVRVAFEPRKMRVNGRPDL